jgi:hypothetical protein
MNKEGIMAEHKNRILLLVIGYWLLANLTGCATIKENVRAIAGVSTLELEAGRKSAIAKTFNYDYFTTYTKTMDALTQLGGYIYAKDIKKQMIAIYVSETDTTPVGFFFKEIDLSNTQIEVSSPSSYAKQYFAEKLFSGLEKPATTEKTTGQQQ